MFWKKMNILPLLGIENRTVEPVAYTQ
jgi:hypothetical protein